MEVSIIGAGISGIGMAIKCHKKNIKYTIYEMSSDVGGLWNKNMGIVNEYSNIQVISPTFKFEDDPTDYSQYTSSDELYEKIKNNCEKFKIIQNIEFNTKVLNFKSIEGGNKVEIKLLNTKNNNISTVTSDALYIRTGTLNTVRKLVLPNEDKFTGIVDYGTNSGKEEIDFKDKIVTIIGFGSTAVENINNAFKKGAKKVIVLARHLKNIWTRKMIYEIVRELIFPTHYLHSSFRRGSWRRINALYDKAYNHLKNETTEQIKKVSLDANSNHKMDRIPAVTEDILIYLHYDMLEIMNTYEISNINGNTVTINREKNFETDIIFKCTGYEMEEGIFSGHTLDNTIFVDGCHNITHNCGLDRGGNDDYYLGPTTDVNVLPLISYPMINHVFDELALYFLQYPQRYTVFTRNKTYSDTISKKNINQINFKSYIYVFWKLIRYLKTSPFDLRLTYRIGMHLWNLRSDVMNNLSRRQFHEIDKKLWDETSLFCYETRMRQIKYLEYPY